MRRCVPRSTKTSPHEPISASTNRPPDSPASAIPVSPRWDWNWTPSSPNYCNSCRCPCPPNSSLTRPNREPGCMACHRPRSPRISNGGETLWETDMVELNDVAREVIDGPHVSILATSNRDGRPQSSVIFVKRDGDTVVFSTIKGRLKTRNMTRDPRVSLLVLDTNTGRSVEIRGTVDITEDPEKTLLYARYER